MSQNNAIAQHTPGPWAWNEKSQLVAVNVMDECEWSDDPSPVVIVETDGGFYPPKGADRSLIAAAPELLEALESALRQYAGVLILAETGRGATDEMIEKVMVKCTPDSPFGQLVAVAKKARGAQ